MPRRPSTRVAGRISPVCRPTAFVVAVLALGSGCSDATAPPVAAPPAAPVFDRAVADPYTSDAVIVDFSDPTADSVRALYVDAGSRDTLTTPWVPASSATVPMVGLAPGASYTVQLRARDATAQSSSAPFHIATAPLPEPVANMHMHFLAGSAFSAGLTLTGVTATDGHGYVVAFDSLGALRWYRDVGESGTQEVKQQTNGDITVYVGNSHGYDGAPGYFLELTPTGDSVRTITAVGSAYTDGHELVVRSSPDGERIADYVFGYDIRPVDRTFYGGGPSDPVAGHQVLKIAPGGAVDTLIQGWGRWSYADAVDGPTELDFDHPNSLDFDLDGGPVVSFRDLGAVIKLDATTDSVVWQLGGAHNQFTFVGDPLNGFSGQHCVRVLPNGHLLIFDNGVAHSPQSSRAVEYALDLAHHTATMVWQYQPSPAVFNEYTGSVQRLANGNTLVSWTSFGLVDEVAPDGSLVARAEIYVDAADGAALYRAIRIGSLYQYHRP